jgi:hypothetical protein
MMAAHYSVGIVPARPYRPRDKAKAEAGVRFAQTYILGRLRHQTFFSLAEANRAIARAAQCRAAPRPARDRRGPLRSPFDSHHQPAADRAIVRGRRRSNSPRPILDRIIHNAYRIELKGESMRKLKAANTEPDARKPVKEAPQNETASASTSAKVRRK